MTDQQGFAGQQQLEADTSEFNRIWFLIRQMIGKLNTVTLVKVQKCSVADAVGPIGLVDVLPLVNLVDGLNNATLHGTIYGVPYFRLQGGANAVICDPKPGDLGICAFASRDISSVKSTKDAAPPGSSRRFDYADALYIGVCLADAPSQYVRFFGGGADDSQSGIDVADKNGNVAHLSGTGIVLQDFNGNKIEMNASGIKFTDKFGHTAALQSSGFDVQANTTTTGTLQNNSVNVGSTHVHGGVQSGASNTAVPH